MTACFPEGHGERDLGSSERNGYGYLKKALLDRCVQKVYIAMRPTRRTTPSTIKGQP